jgi:Na+/proline symporter
MIFPIPILRTE